MGRPVPAFASSSASSNLSPQLLLLFLLSASSTLTNFSIEEIPQAGPDPGVPEPPRCLTAPARRASEQTSRQEVAIPAAGQPWGRGAGRQGGSPGSGGGGSPGPGLGAGGCRAPGRRLPATEGPRRSRDGEVPGHTGPEVPVVGSPDRGLSRCTLHWATPAPSLQHFGVTGMGPSLQQPISGRSGA